MQPLQSEKAITLSGTALVPGDKSISHRALMIGSLTVGETRIRGLLESQDVLHTAAALRALGAHLARDDDGLWRVHGVGVGGLMEADRVLDMGNSGTAARLLLGLLASHPLTTFVTGDASLTRRPMARVTRPLEHMGASFISRSGGRLPMAVLGTEQGVPIVYRLPVASAQVKSAILLAGLNLPGRTTVIETEPTRDHTERMLTAFGAEVRTERTEDGALAVTVTGEVELAPQEVIVPADISSAAFPLVAALLVPDSELTIRDVGLNPRRIGLIETLTEMGASIDIGLPRQTAGEPIADLIVRASALKGVEVPPARVPSMIDEFPILAMAAALADGPTVMQGIGELRVKESDRLTAIADGLTACGVQVEAGADSLTVHGRPTGVPGGATVATQMDHRIAMSFLVLGLVSAAPIRVDDGTYIDTSFPGFVTLMNGLGARITPA